MFMYISMLSSLIALDGHVHQVRAWLLGEMCARAAKVLLRRLLRSSNERCGHPASRASLLTALVTHVLNLVTGADSGSQEFWTTQLTLQVLMSFGHRCVARGGHAPPRPSD